MATEFRPNALNLWIWNLCKLGLGMFMTIAFIAHLIIVTTLAYRYFKCNSGNDNDETDTLINVNER